MTNPERSSGAVLGDAHRASDAPHADVAKRAALLREWAAASLVAVCGVALRVGVLWMMAKQNDDKLWGLLSKWDAKYYTEIARVGYFNADVGAEGNAYETTMAFFPGFPFTIKLLTFLGMSEAVAAEVLNFIFLVIMAAGVMALAARMKAPFAARVAAATVVTSAPMSIVFTMPYTESLFGAIVFWGLVALHDKNWLRAGALGFALSAVRLTSVDFLLVFGVFVLLYGRKEWRAWASLVASAIPLVTYILWANSYLEPAGGYFGIQKAHWNSGFDYGVATAKWVWSTLTTSGDVGYLLSTTVIVGAPILLYLTWSKLPPAVWLFCAALVANVLLSDGIMHSRPRLLLPAALLLMPFAIEAVAKLKPRTAGALLAVWALWGAWFSGHMLAVFEWAI